MHDMIHRYVEETVSHLPMKDRDDVARELETNILDMVGNEADLDVVEKTLLDLGSPQKLASQYRKTPRHLIGPDTFDSYLMVLKLVSVIVFSVTLILTILSFFLTVSDLNIYEMIAKSIASVFSALTGVFLWVTIIFAVMDYYQVKTDFQQWNVEALRNLEKSPSHLIKKSESIGDLVGLSIFFLFLAIVYSRNEVVAIYQVGRESIPLFVTDLIRPYILGWMVITLLSFAVAILKLLKGRWTKPLLGISAASDLVGVFYFIYVATNWQLYNPQFINFFTLGLSSWPIIVRAASAALLILTLVSIADDVYT
ncbi:MAG: hypothetical protein EOM15_12825, partial [Spirochaetia bacterium]|nr:hypothetical protein [Spirochaetia bacterium]